MRYYFFGDIHGNEYALERCFDHVQKVKPDRLYCLGDLVGWLPFGDRTLKRMQSAAVPSVAGNHDLLVAGLFTDHPEKLDRMQATAYNAGLLSTLPGAIDYLVDLPLTVEQEDFVITHHSPFHLPAAGERITIESFNYLDEAAISECVQRWQVYPKKIIFSGHDHIPAVFELPEVSRPAGSADVIVHRIQRAEPLIVKLKADSRYWVKAGSVGGPYRDGLAVCNTVLFDTDSQIITLFRLPYSTTRLRQELARHRFYGNLPAMKRYIELLNAGKPD